MADTKLTVSIVVPVKDEAGNAATLAREIAGVMDRSAPGTYEILFVDDGSQDSTVDELALIRGEIPALRILSHARNLGQSHAVRSGVKRAKSDLIVTLDGDGQNDPADIPKLLAVFAAAKGDSRLALVAGQRLKRQDNWKKRMASRSANRIRGWLLADNARDVGCGLKAFRKDAFLQLPYFDHMHRYLIALMLREGYAVEFVDVGHRPRRTGASKYGVLDRAAVGISDLLGVMWLKRRFRAPADIKEL